MGGNSGRELYCGGESRSRGTFGEGNLNRRMIGDGCNMLVELSGDVVGVVMWTWYVDEEDSLCVFAGTPAAFVDRQIGSKVRTGRIVDGC